LLHLLSEKCPDEVLAHSSRHLVRFTERERERREEKSQ
jgi:hypothetical protein